MVVLLLSVMGAFAKFEKYIICNRQRIMGELAKHRGVYREREKRFSYAIKVNYNN